MFQSSEDYIRLTFRSRRATGATGATGATDLRIVAEAALAGTTLVVQVRATIDETGMPLETTFERYKAF